ncbi:glycosyl hydrolase family 65 protein, partial [Corynebacterium pyruviciproducens]
LNYRGRLIEVYADHKEIKVSLLKGADLEIIVKGDKVQLKEGETQCLKA